MAPNLLQQLREIDRIRSGGKLASCSQPGHELGADEAAGHVAEADAAGANKATSVPNHALEALDVIRRNIHARDWRCILFQQTRRAQSGVGCVWGPCMGYNSNNGREMLERRAMVKW
jgi:hypothetical protein